MESCLLAICHKDYTEFMRIWPPNSAFSAKMKIFQVKALELRDFIVITENSVNILAFYLWVSYKVVPYKNTCILNAYLINVQPPSY